MAKISIDSFPYLVNDGKDYGQERAKREIGELTRACLDFIQSSPPARIEIIKICPYSWRNQDRYSYRFYMVLEVLDKKIETTWKEIYPENDGTLEEQMLQALTESLNEVLESVAREARSQLQRIERLMKPKTPRS